MRTNAQMLWAPASDCRASLVWIGIVWVAVAAGFILDFAEYASEQLAPPFILHFNAVVFLLWLRSITARIIVIEIRSVGVHKGLDWWTVGVSALIIPLGLAAASVDQVRTASQPDFSPQFLSLEFEETCALTIFMVAGILLRKRPAAHIRLMVLAAIAILDAGFARIVKTNVPEIVGWWLQYFWGIFLLLVTMMAWDLWRHRRIHPALIFGAALFWSSQLIATLLNFSPAWHDDVVRLVHAWGYQG